VAEATAGTSSTTADADLEATWAEWSRGVQKVDERAMTLLRAADRFGTEQGGPPTDEGGERPNAVVLDRQRPNAVVLDRQRPNAVVLDRQRPRAVVFDRLSPKSPQRPSSHGPALNMDLVRVLVFIRPGGPALQ